MAEGGDSEKDEDLNAERRRRIQDLVKSIGSQRKSKQHKTPEMENPKKRPRGMGRHPSLKLQLGWLHQTRGRYRQVTVRKGGGTRTYEFPRDEKQTVETITSYAKKIFFPGGKNDLGQLHDMEVVLSTYTGEVIDKFYDSDGKECCLQEYLKSLGVFSSQYYLYLRTSKKPENEICPEEENLTTQTSMNSWKVNAWRNLCEVHETKLFNLYWRDFL